MTFSSNGPLDKCLVAGQYPDFHIIILSSHTGLYVTTGLLHKGAPKKQQKSPLDVYYQDANKMRTSNDKFQWRLLATYANKLNLNKLITKTGNQAHKVIHIQLKSEVYVHLGCSI